MYRLTAFSPDDVERPAEHRSGAEKCYTLFNLKLVFGRFLKSWNLVLIASTTAPILVPTITFGFLWYSIPIPTNLLTSDCDE